MKVGDKVINVRSESSCLKKGLIGTIYEIVEYLNEPASIFFESEEGIKYAGIASNFDLI